LYKLLAKTIIFALKGHPDSFQQERLDCISLSASICDSIYVLIYGHKLL